MSRISRTLTIVIASALALLGAIVTGVYVYGFLTLGPPSRWDRYANGGEFVGCRPNGSPTRSELVYSSPLTGRGDIYLAQFDGTIIKRLTSDLNYEGDPAWSPDGEAIAFVRENDRGANIWKIDRDGSNLIQVTNAEGFYDSWPSFSMDGKMLVFSRTWMNAVGSTALNNELYAIRLDGTEEARLTFNDRADCQASYVGANGRILYCVDAKEIRTLDPSTLQSQLICQGNSPAISPNHKTIAFIDDRSGSFAYNIVTIGIDGQNATQITASGGYKSEASFLPDGRHLLFLQGSSRAAGWTVMRADIVTHETESLFAIGMHRF